MRSLGWQFEETLRGTYHLLANPTDERPIQLAVVVRALGLRAFTLHKTAIVTGTIDLQGFADQRPVSGTLAFRHLQERRIPYELHFQGNDTLPYIFRGQRDLRLIALADALTALPGSIYSQDDDEIGRATLRFDWRGELAKVFRSFRILLKSPHSSGI